MRAGLREKNPRPTKRSVGREWHTPYNALWVWHSAEPRFFCEGRTKHGETVVKRVLFLLSRFWDGHIGIRGRGVAIVPDEWHSREVHSGYGADCGDRLSARRDVFCVEVAGRKLGKSRADGQMFGIRSQGAVVRSPFRLHRNSIM